MFSSRILEQQLPKSEESTKLLKYLKFYQNIFCGLFVVSLAFTKVNFMMIYAGMSLMRGIRALCPRALASFCFLILLHLGTHLSVLDDVLSEKRTLTLLETVYYISDALVSLYGIRVSFRGYQILEAERLGFIDTRRTLVYSNV